MAHGREKIGRNVSIVQNRLFSTPDVIKLNRSP